MESVKPDTAAAKVPGYALVLEQYVCDKTPIQSAVTEVENLAPNDRAVNSIQKSTERTGCNKKRPRDARIELEDNLCRGLAREGPVGCSYGNSCKFNHDVQDYLKRKQKDLGESCYLFETYGFCPTGLTCRFGSTHIDAMLGLNVRKADKAEVPNPLNCVSEHVKALLRSRKFPFRHQRQDERKSKKNKEAARKAVETVEDAPVKDEPSILINLNGLKQEKEEMNGQPLTKVLNQEDVPASSSKLNDLGVDADVSASPSAHKTGCGAIPPMKKLVDFRGKVYVAPLTTVGNLPFRRIMKKFGADITCSEMAMAPNLLSGQRSEWALMKRHTSEDVFGVQLAGSHPDQFIQASEVIQENCSVDFFDINLGCPIDVVCQRGGGAALMQRPNKLAEICRGLFAALDCPVTIKMRTGWNDVEPLALKLAKSVQKVVNEMNAPSKCAAIMIHGRSRLQRYTRLANWEYINSVARDQEETNPVPIIGNGDILSWMHWEEIKSAYPSLVDCAMLGRGALIKPWLPTEIKEKRDWDISSSERFDILKDFVNYGMEHWGSDQQGVNTTRRFLLEWLSFTYRYIPVGILEALPQRINEKPPAYFGRNDLETLMASNKASDWVRISEMLLGPVAEGFKFAPKHKANAYTN